MHVVINTAQWSKATKEDMWYWWDLLLTWMWTWVLSDSIYKRSIAHRSQSVEETVRNFFLHCTFILYPNHKETMFYLIDKSEIDNKLMNSKSIFLLFFTVKKMASSIFILAVLLGFMCVQCKFLISIQSTFPYGKLWLAYLEWPDYAWPGYMI